jgi:hypothetical protein
MEKKDLTKEQLIELAKKPLKKMKQLLVDYDDVRKFSIMRQLKSDKNNYVPTYIIFENYVEWCSQNDATPMSRGLFFKKFSSIFERAKKNGDMHYLITGQGMTLSDYTSSQKEIMKSAYSKRISSNAEKKQAQKTRNKF